MSSYRAINQLKAIQLKAIQLGEGMTETEQEARARLEREILLSWRFIPWHLLSLQVQEIRTRPPDWYPKPKDEELPA